MAKPVAVKAAGFLEMGDILCQHFHSSDCVGSTQSVHLSDAHTTGRLPAKQDGPAMQGRMDGGWWLPSYEQDPISMHWHDVHGQNNESVPNRKAAKSKRKQS